MRIYKWRSHNKTKLVVSMIASVMTETHYTERLYYGWGELIY